MLIFLYYRPTAYPKPLGTVVFLISKFHYFSFQGFKYSYYYISISFAMLFCFPAEDQLCPPNPLKSQYITLTFLCSSSVFPVTIPSRGPQGLWSAELLGPRSHHGLRDVNSLELYNLAAPSQRFT